MLTNMEKSTISFRHGDQIRKIFNNYIKGELYLEHFSINVFFGNGESIFLSPTPKMAENLCKYDFVNYDSNYKKEIYSKNTIYTWREVQKHSMDRVINHIKEEKFSLRNGMMIVRNLGDNRYVMYSFATTKKGNYANHLYLLYLIKANYIAEMGDFMYNELNEIVNEYSMQQKISMPKINKASDIELESRFITSLQKDLYHHMQQLAKSDVGTLKVTN